MASVLVIFFWKDEVNSYRKFVKGVSICFSRLFYSLYYYVQHCNNDYRIVKFHHTFIGSSVLLLCVRLPRRWRGRQLIRPHYNNSVNNTLHDNNTVNCSLIYRNCWCYWKRDLLYPSLSVSRMRRTSTQWQNHCRHPVEFGLIARLLPALCQLWQEEVVVVVVARAVLPLLLQHRLRHPILMQHQSALSNWQHRIGRRPFCIERVWKGLGKSTCSQCSSGNWGWLVEWILLRGNTSCISLVKNVY